MKKFKLLKSILSISLTIILSFVIMSCSQNKVIETSKTTEAVSETTEAIVKTNDNDIAILYTNDIHCGVDDNIGYASLAEYKNQSLSKTPYTILIDAGDFLQGAPIGTLSSGEDIVKIMNKVGFDFATCGNHEFDYGMNNLIERASELNCHVYSANIMDTRTNKPLFDPYKVFSFGNFKVALVGATTPESLTKSTPTYFQDDKGNYIYGFCEDENGNALYNSIQNAINDARKEADFVILVGHMGNEGSTARWSSNTLISKLSGIDAFIDGHSHEVVPGTIIKDKDGKDVILTQTGTKLANIGELTITKDGTLSTKLINKVNMKDGTTAPDPKTLKEDESMPDGFNKNGNAYDKSTNDFIVSIMDKFKESLQAVIGKSGFLLTTKDKDGNRKVRNGETNLGDLASDAYRVVLGGDIGLVNGGGIRAEIPAGDITYETALTVFPFNNMGCLVEVNGQVIKDALELSCSKYPEESGGFLQISGITYTINSQIPSSVVLDEKGNFLSVSGEYRASDIKVNGEDLDLTKMYKVASHNYMLKNGGDGYSMFKGSNVLKDSVLPDVDVFVDYLKAEGTTNYSKLDGEGRITIK
ncbi:MAG: bifunctional UDP-sugar hydrolase/5'-nucleotidase [Eubacteriales bacterium]|nr:bifunctional UDP-sugar hydrolase/5'-nucleotidase [Eubacteriales bacterium]